MKKKWWILIFAVVLLVAVGQVVLRGKKKQLEVSAVRAKVDDVKVTVSATETGTVKATNEVLVVPRVSGELVFLGIAEGDRVTAGQVIARLDSRETEDQVHSAEAQLAAMRSRIRETEISANAQPHVEQATIKQAQAGVDTAQASLDIAKRGARPEEIASAQAQVDEAQISADNAKRNLDRQQGLLDKGFVSRSVVESAQADYDMAVARLNSAKQSLQMRQNQVRPEDVHQAEQQLKQAQAGLQQAIAGAIQSKTLVESLKGLQAQAGQLDAELGQMRTRLGYLTITAPISGLVTHVNCKQGQFVMGGTSYGLQAEQMSMATIADMGDLWVEATINEADVAKVQIGQKVEVSSDAFMKRTFHGKLVDISPAALADRQNIRSFKCEVLLNDAGGYLRPGMSAEMEIVTKLRKGVLTIPTQALLDESGKRKVWLVEDGVLKKKTVTIGDKSWERVEIKSGLKKGQQVVTTIDEKGLKEGEKVKIKKELGGKDGKPDQGGTATASFN